MIHSLYYRIYNPVGDLFKVSRENLDTIAEGEGTTVTNIEPVDLNSLPPANQAYTEKGYKGVAHPEKSISWWASGRAPGARRR